MKLFCWFLFAVLALQQQLLMVTAQDDNEDDGQCTDSFTWCPSSRHFCDQALVERSCKKTCGVCEKSSNACFEYGCEFNCIEVDDGILCTCPDGHRLEANRRNCTDIDECAGENPCTNPQTPVCLNFEGSFTCLPCAGLRGHTTYYQSEMCCEKASNLSSCGQNSETGTRAPSGANLELGRWPWTTLISIGARKCTGVLISEDWILAPAHCFAGFAFNVDSVTVQVGIRNSNPLRANEHSRRINVAQVIIHDNYNFPSNDIALVRLAQPTNRSWAVRPICLPNGEIPDVTQRCYMSGYESFFNEQGIEELLVSSGITLESSTRCRNNLGRFGEQADYNNVLCGLYDIPTQNSCPGETGGPIVCQRCDSCSWYVAGIMAFGDQCLDLQEDFYAGYASIETYESWIAQHTGLDIRSDRTCASTRTAWRPWGQWGSCSQSCGGGSYSRTRQCRSGTSGSPGCDGSEVDVQNCNTHRCPAWGPWTLWSRCSETCGEGTRDRRRFCLRGTIGQLGCHEGTNSETETCNDDTCARWGEWTTWSGCSSTCGRNEQELSFRNCNGGSQGDAGCEGDQLRFRSCNLGPCPVWSRWGDWSSCSITCGGRGEETSTRECLNEGVCQGEARRRRDCLTPTCPPEFTPWSDCSVTCGAGVQRRRRICSEEHRGCVEITETQDCRLRVCPPTITFTSWTACPATCGRGVMQTRQRTECQGDNSCSTSEESRPCDVPVCMGEWSRWSDFGECASTCGQGIATRVRECLNGDDCEGRNIEAQECNRDPCPTGTAATCTDQRFWCGLASLLLCGTSETVNNLCPVRCGTC